MEVSNVVSPFEPEARVRLSVEFNPVDHAFAASLFSLRASEAGWTQAHRLIGPINGPPQIQGPTIVDTVGQIHFPPIVFANPANPIAVFEATWVTGNFRHRVVTLDTVTQRFDVYIDAMSPASESRMATLIEGRGEIRVIPAPGAVCALGAFGLASLRRYRR